MIPTVLWRNSARNNLARVLAGCKSTPFGHPGKTVGVGQSFLVTFNGQDHELELIAVERTTFTVRLRGEEITRPIKPTK